jgi:hypothetical protein
VTPTSAGTGSTNFYTSSGYSTPAATYTLSSGTSILYLKAMSAGTTHITINDSNGKTAASNSFEIIALPDNGGGGSNQDTDENIVENPSLSIVINGDIIAGNPTNATIYLNHDSSVNYLPRKITLSSPDSQVQFLSGNEIILSNSYQSTFPVRFLRAGNHKIKAEISSLSILGESTFRVKPGPPACIVLTFNQKGKKAEHRSCINDSTSSSNNGETLPSISNDISGFTLNVPIDLTVTITDYMGDIVTDYTGTIKINVEGINKINLPNFYTFKLDDNGTHTFLTAFAILNKNKATLSITDTNIPDLTTGTMTFTASSNTSSTTSKKIFLILFIIFLLLLLLFLIYRRKKKKKNRN